MSVYAAHSCPFLSYPIISLPFPLPILLLSLPFLTPPISPESAGLSPFLSVIIVYQFIGVIYISPYPPEYNSLILQDGIKGIGLRKREKTEGVS